MNIYKTLFGPSGDDMPVDIGYQPVRDFNVRAVTSDHPVYHGSLYESGPGRGIIPHMYASEHAQRVSWRGVFSTCVQMRADAIAAALCKSSVKRVIGEGEFEDVEPDNPWRLLWNRPSLEYDRYFFFEQVSKLRDWGKGAFMSVFRQDQDFQVVIGGVTYKIPSVDLPVGMEIVYPYFADVNVKGNENGGISGFVQYSRGGDTVDIPRSEMIWMRHPHPVTPYEASSLLMRGMYESDTSMYQAIYARNIAKEGNVPNVYLTSDQDIGRTQAEQFGERITRDYRSAASIGSGKTLVLGKGTTMETISMSPDDMQAIDSANLTSNQIYVLCGFPPEMFAEGGTLANSKEGRLKWLQNSIQPEVDKICESFTHQLSVVFGSDYGALRIVPPDVVPVDRKQEQTIREMMLRTGQRTIDEFRRSDGLDETGTGAGSTFFLSAGLRPADSIVNPQRPQLDPEAPGDGEDDQDKRLASLRRRRIAL